MAKPIKQNSGQLRIIGGKWRGRKINFPVITDLRPTPDRIRETVFNWLQPFIGGACCVDLFAGSGAMGFEAASRGAAQVDMIEFDRSAFNAIQLNKTQIDAQACHLFHTTAQQFINHAGTTYDIVFIDPPFQANLWFEIGRLLEHHNCLAENSLIYVECPKKQDLPILPSNWQLKKDKTAGDVRYCLFNRI